MSEQKPLPELTREEFAAVTEAFEERLREAMGRAGCNDVFSDEFPESVCAKFRFDLDVLEAWTAYRLKLHEAGKQE